MSDSEEEEYNNTGIVYDSENSEDDFNSEDEEVVIFGFGKLDFTCTGCCLLTEPPRG